MSFEVVATQALQGLSLGFVIGFIDEWNRKVMAGIIFTYFIALAMVTLVGDPSSIASTAFPSDLATLAELIMAFAGIHGGHIVYKQSFGGDQP